MALVAEFTVEPFAEADPGPHVRAALGVAEASGLPVDFGPFGTSVRGDDGRVLAVVDGVLRAALDAGAARVSVQIQRPAHAHR